MLIFFTLTLDLFNVSYNMYNNNLTNWNSRSNLERTTSFFFEIPDLTSGWVRDSDSITSVIIFLDFYVNLTIYEFQFITYNLHYKSKISSSDLYISFIIK